MCYNYYIMMPTFMNAIKCRVTKNSIYSESSNWHNWYNLCKKGAVVFVHAQENFKLCEYEYQIIKFEKYPNIKVGFCTNNVHEIFKFPMNNKC